MGQGIDGAQVLAQRLRKTIAETGIDASGPRELRVTTSIGIAEHRRDESLDSLIRRADAALYQAERRGRNCVELAEP
jgi:diguanylate cyclase (GGDEF)-like protein